MRSFHTSLVRRLVPCLAMWLLWGAVTVLSFAATTAVAADRVAEDQTPTGKFLTATEIKPILSATKSNWIAVRKWEGQDLLYFTHLLSWRCGLYEIRYAVNGDALRAHDFPACDADSYTLGAIPPDAQIYTTFPLESVETITIELLYDDMSTERAEFRREEVLIP